MLQFQKNNNYKILEVIKMKRFSLLLPLLLGLFLLAGCGLTPEEAGAEEADATTLSPTVTVTFPEGYTAAEIAERLEENGVCSAAEFMALTSDPVFLSESTADCLSDLPADAVSECAFALEGYIFPDTYEFYRGESPRRAIGRFLNNTSARLTEEHRARAEELGFTMDEIITLASIIQKEAGFKEEMPKVSSVLHNRLKSPEFQKLQCDVTIHYVNKFITDSPYLTGDTAGYAEKYNTYKCKGLPAGPICNPGLDAIEAALYPADTDYYYFVTDSDNNYYYAETYEQHKENCKAVGLEG